MQNHTIFQKIIQKKSPAKIIYQNNLVTAFEDIQPKAPVHILIIPNFFIQSLNEINKKNKYILLHMFDAAIDIAKRKKINQTGYRIIINCNKDGGQEIKYLHLHLLGGKKLGIFS